VTAVRARTAVAFLAGAAASLALWSVIAFTAGVGGGSTAMDRVYRETLLRELRTDEVTMRSLLDTIDAEQAGVERWVGVLEGGVGAPPKSMMDGLRDSMEPVRFRPHMHVFGEMEALGHWAVLPEPDVRQQIRDYYVAATAWNGIGESEQIASELGLASVLESDEWRWLVYHLPDEAVFFDWREPAERLWNRKAEVLGVLRVLEKGHDRRRQALEELLETNVALQEPIRAWVRGADR
jgi:hypothetical protein